MYHIKEGYNHRTDVDNFNDLVNNNEAHQKEVYQNVAQFMQKEKLKSVTDVGCGSGFKLVKYFSNFKTYGLDLPATIDQVELMYPDHDWGYSEVLEFPDIATDVVLCSDVIEHIENPDHFLHWLSWSTAKDFFFSTPDRDIVRAKGDNGPPKNASHYREWNQEEFLLFLSDYFTPVDARITNLTQGTFLVHCVKKVAE